MGKVDPRVIVTHTLRVEGFVVDLFDHAMVFNALLHANKISHASKWLRVSNTKLGMVKSRQWCIYKKKNLTMK